MLIDTIAIEPNALERFKRWGFGCPIAEDPETGARLTVSDGQRRSGRPRRYYITVPRVLLPAGYHDQTLAGTVTAFYDDEAIAKANRRLPKLLAKAH